MSIDNCDKRACLFGSEILPYMLFHKNNCRFSSLLNIYKSLRIWYNIDYWQATACQVPLFCTPHSVLRNAKLMASLRLNGLGCAILIYVVKNSKLQAKNTPLTQKSGSIACFFHIFSPFQTFFRAFPGKCLFYAKAAALPSRSRGLPDR